MSHSQGFEILESLKDAGANVSQAVLEQDQLLQVHQSREGAIFHVGDLVLTQITVCKEGEMKCIMDPAPGLHSSRRNCCRERVSHHEDEDDDDKDVCE